ncbi:uncharacterized protein LOC132563221 [Ylistrum balloti]|uniref:uncharacterized protein LOC132563221 n=1 Tax=Ylistrum balloti TaxID=509963 RepID=UPI002905D431|nr:uncharacterized protein LOC132563221 [Ylistrum balloti]
MQDATAQMALLQFMQSKLSTITLPASVHCDHLILAKRNALLDLSNAKTQNKEIYDFLLSACRKYGLDFWEPGAGIIHQVTLENYAIPGMMIIGTDSHTPNAGGICSIAVGVGGADAVDALVGMPWELLMPKIIGVHLKGTVSPWCSPKDIILKLAGELTVKGGTGYIIEYFGEGVHSLSCTGRATIGNMGAEVGATTSIFPMDDNILEYITLTERKHVADIAVKHAEICKADDEVLQNPHYYYDKVINIDLSTLEPYINGPYSPDRATPLSDFARFIQAEKYPEHISAALIGSCTNSSYEDLSRVYSLLTQAKKKKLALRTPLWLSPGSENIYQIIKHNGYLTLFEQFGTHVLANACGPCIGQWKRSDINENDTNSIINSFNRNFAKRADGNPNTHSFVSSPEIVTAMALSGSLLFNPMKDSLINSDKEPVQLSPPDAAPPAPRELLHTIFGSKPKGLITANEDEIARKKHIVSISPDSERLQELQPFEAWTQKNFTQLYLLIKAKGKCTTDHISMAGPWLRYRGHLENISKNLLIGAVNAFNDKTNHIYNPFTHTYQEIELVAQHYKIQKSNLIIVGDENYGEGSSREHAALEPRFMGVKVVLAKSFARIHETNLKKQGILPLLFIDPTDYDRIQERDSIDVLRVTELLPQSRLELVLHHDNGSTHSFEVTHTLNATQTEWFKQGSALNMIKNTLSSA